MLSLHNINAFYGPIQALFDVSLEVRQGEIVCLLGGNASGKSTTMKTILGLVKPRGGQVVLDGEDITSLATPQRVRRGLASVPEARRIFPRMTVRENLLMGAYTRRDKAIGDDLARVLDLFPRLKERLGQSGGTLSGGEQQMLALGRALMSRPRLICMDEPSMGLAPKLVQQSFELIQQVNAQGVTIFVVEQNAQVALSIAHRGYVLQNGAMALSGPAQELLHNPDIRRVYLGEVAA
ncbi:MAG: ABC transporter ATP-binding protein [Anaerolineae bacterium]|nr:ABC transporter ATP-binding protein [Anaerolineae bacterium]